MARFASLGDSFSVMQARSGRTWAGELADWLAASNPDLVCCTFARPGATSRDLLGSQLEGALAFSPDLSTVICGANDVLLTAQLDVYGYAERLTHVIRQLLGHGRVITATCPLHVGILPLNVRVRTRFENAIDLLNEATRAVARHMAVPYLELGRRVLPEVETDDSLRILPVWHDSSSPAADIAMACKVALGRLA